LLQEAFNAAKEEQEQEELRRAIQNEEKAATTSTTQILPLVFYKPWLAQQDLKLAEGRTLLDTTISQYEGQLALKDARIDKQKKQLALKDAQIDKKNALIKSLQHQLAAATAASTTVFARVGVGDEMKRREKRPPTPPTLNHLAHPDATTAIEAQPTAVVVASAAGKMITRDDAFAKASPAEKKRKRALPGGMIVNQTDLRERGRHRNGQGQSLH
jgi:hypothetical protein